MKKYVVNNNRTSNPGLHHEVHTEEHAKALWIVSYTNLDFFPNAVQAVALAKTIYPDADGCSQCSPEAHTG